MMICRCFLAQSAQNAGVTVLGRFAVIAATKIALQGGRIPPMLQKIIGNKENTVKRERGGR
jgi:hypothetical protein